MLELALYPGNDRGRMLLYAHTARRKGRAEMAKDMSGVYADMLTKELTALRMKHLIEIRLKETAVDRKSRADVARRRDLVAQINHELAMRITNFGLKV